jgi:hypothetical protein
MKNILFRMILSTLLGIIIFAPLLVPGYILSFDMTWGPEAYAPENTSNIWLLYKLISTTSLVANWLPQKLIIFAIILVSSIGAIKLVSITNKYRANMLIVFAGIFYLFNPFFYIRLVAGQWLVLIGYALLPWTVLAIWKFLNKPQLKTAWPVLAWLAAIGFTSIHTLGIVALIALVMFFVTFRIQLKQKLILAAGIVAAWAVINLVWLIPLLTGSSKSGQSIQSFGGSQLQAFATNGTIFDSPALSALFLTGFWADDQGRYSLPSDLGVVWYIAAFLLFGLMITGLVYVIRKKDKLGISIAIAAFIAWILAVGIAWNVTAPLTQFLHQYVALYAGYREPQKWLMLVAVAYAYLGTMGLVSIVEILKRRNLQKFIMPVFFIAIILPILFTPNLAWGAGGQLKSVQYPSGWAQAAETLESVPEDTKILVLPWHMYLHVGFADRVVANPTKYYFTQDMIVGNNSELKGVPPVNQDKLHGYINNDLLPQRNKVTDAGTQLSKYGVKYVLLLKEADYKTYGWVSKQTDLTVVEDNDSLTLYKINEKH